MLPIGRPGPLHWLGLAGLVAMWGSSYLAMEIALRAFSPLAITAARIVLAAATLWSVMRLAGLRLPTDRGSWAFFVVLSVVGNCLPFFLISWGQQSVPSGLAGIAMAVTPLAVILLAHFLLPDEPLTAGRIAGFLAGFLGVALLVGPGFLLGERAGGSLTGLLAVLGGALCYATTAVITRLGPSHHPLVMSTAVTLAGSLILVPLYFALDGGVLREFALPVGPLAAVAALGMLSTGFAAVIFFFLVTQVGAGFMTMQSFLVPPWAVVTGALVLDERLHPGAYAAMILILAGLAIAQRFDRTGRGVSG
ncbi:MAG TPA: DMT family transporter [Woeseiaceae bacterium]|nr:DMT family transporter [Woeseiaceae bacterium]